MFNKKKIGIIAISLAAGFLPILAIGQLSPGGLPLNRPAASITVSSDGSAKVKNIVVFQIAGSTLFARTYWGDSFIRWTIRTSQNTNFLKLFGGRAQLSDIAVGDVLNVDGNLLSGSDSLNVNATDIRDLNLEKENGSFSGRVTEVDAPDGEFRIITDSGLMMAVDVGSAVSIKKGEIYIPLSKVVPGDVASYVSGIYDQPNQKIAADRVEIYQDQSIFAPRNFQGTLKSLSAAGLPATVVVTVKGADYNVVLSNNAQVLTANRKNTQLQRFVAGDSVRFYGSIRKTDLTTVDAEIIRNLNL